MLISLWILNLQCNNLSSWMLCINATVVLLVYMLISFVVWLHWLVQIGSSLCFMYFYGDTVVLLKLGRSYSWIIEILANLWGLS